MASKHFFITLSPPPLPPDCYQTKCLRRLPFRARALSLSPFPTILRNSWPAYRPKAPPKSTGSQKAVSFASVLPRLPRLHSLSSHSGTRREFWRYERRTQRKLLNLYDDQSVASHQRHSFESREWATKSCNEFEFLTGVHPVFFGPEGTRSCTRPRRSVAERKGTR